MHLKECQCDVEGKVDEVWSVRYDMYVRSKKDQEFTFFYCRFFFSKECKLSKRRKNFYPQVNKEDAGAH